MRKLTILCIFTSLVILYMGCERSTELTPITTNEGEHEKGIDAGGTTVDAWFYFDPIWENHTDSTGVYDGYFIYHCAVNLTVYEYIHFYKFRAKLDFSDIDEFVEVDTLSIEWTSDYIDTMKELAESVPSPPYAVSTLYYDQSETNETFSFRIYTSDPDDDFDEDLDGIVILFDVLLSDTTSILAPDWDVVKFYGSSTDSGNGDGIPVPKSDWDSTYDHHKPVLTFYVDFTVPTATFRTLYVFLILSLGRQRIIHFNVTSNPTADWTSLQLTQAFPFDTAPQYLIRDRDGVYGPKVIETLGILDIEQIVTAPRSPWQNGYCERVVGTIRRECLDHVIVLSENHLLRVLKEFLAYYHGSRTHLGLGKDSPEPRQIQSQDIGPVRSLPVLSGLHHRYYREAA